MGHLNSSKPAALIQSIRSERDYLEAKKQIAHEMAIRHQDDASERIEVLMQAVLDYERRFVDDADQDDDAVEDSHEAGLEDWDGPSQRWRDSLEA